ncbi:MAG: hypothetical protein M0036_19855, partial [Desulfobacteraceae bacterium]|nr:hypothetical protein [Desulfobacteraceae bacterium]
RSFEIALRLGQIVATQNLMAPIFYQPPDISLSKIAEQLDAHAQGRDNWVQGAGVENAVRIMQRLYRRGGAGPLWEYLVR